MRNPFQSEIEAFRFVLVTAVAFAAIAGAGIVVGTWAGVAAWAVLSVAAAGFYLARRRRLRELKPAPPHVGGPSERRVLVVADDVVVEEEVEHAIRHATTGYRSEVLVICPAHVSGVDRWTSAVDRGRERARDELDASVARLRADGIVATGELGDDDLMRALEDALSTFAADEVIIATRAGAEAGLDAVAVARERFAVPITHVPVRAGELAAAVAR